MVESTVASEEIDTGKATALKLFGYAAQAAGLIGGFMLGAPVVALLPLVAAQFFSGLADDEVDRVKELRAQGNNEQSKFKWEVLGLAIMFAGLVAAGALGAPPFVSLVPLIGLSFGQKMVDTVEKLENQSMQKTVRNAVEKDSPELSKQLGNEKEIVDVPKRSDGKLWAEAVQSRAESSRQL
jgi:xanthosine utilization system XapX-like protein